MIDFIKKKLLLRSNDYKACFLDGFSQLTPSAKNVMHDLMHFCNVNTSTAFVNKDGVVDPIRMAFEEGRRTVFNRIRYYLNLTDAELQQAKKLIDQQDESY